MDNKTKIKHLASIESYINGTLNQEEIDKLWVEFLKDQQLYEYFVTELHLQNLRKRGKLPAGFIKPGGDKVTEQLRTYKVWKYAAAAIILLVASLQLFRAEDFSNQGISALSFATIDYTELAGAAIYRSDNDMASDLDIRLNEGLAQAYENNTDLAIDTFSNLLTAELSPEQLIRVNLNLGILYYNQGDYHEAATYFQSVTELGEPDKPLTEKGWWYLGNSLLQTGDIAGAKEAVLYTYQMSGRFRNDASEWLEKIDGYL